MEDTGFASYQDPRLSIPPEESETTAADFMRDCIHSAICCWRCGCDPTDSDELVADRLGCHEGCKYLETF